VLLLYSCFLPFLTSLVSGSVASDLGFVSHSFLIRFLFVVWAVYY